MEEVDRPTAEVFAGWFRCLADPSRILILNMLARAAAPMSVGEIVKAMDMGQSTVSHHLKILMTAGAVLVDRKGTSSYYRVDDRCLQCFPSAAELIMGIPEPKYGPAKITCLPAFEDGARPLAGRGRPWRGRTEPVD